MQWIYDGLKESILIQSLLLYWSIYGIYVAVIKNSNYTKEINYKISNKKDKTIITFWYCGKHDFVLTNPLNITIKISDMVDKVIICSNNLLRSIIKKENKLIIIKSEIKANDVIEVEIDGENKVTSDIIQHNDISTFELQEIKKISYFIALCAFLVFTKFFFASSVSLISSFLDAKWDEYSLLNKKVEQAGFSLVHEFEDTYLKIYDMYDDVDTRNFEISVSLKDKYGFDLPYNIFVEIEEEILANRVKIILECMCVFVILIYIITKYLKKVTIPKILGNEKYILQLKGKRIYFAKYKNRK